MFFDRLRLSDNIQVQILLDNGLISALMKNKYSPIIISEPVSMCLSFQAS